MQKNNLAKDSIILAIVKVITICTSLIQTMFLSRIMSLTEYGVYSQLLIVISIVTTFSNLGLNNAINYFYNRYDEKREKERYINVIFSLTIMAGVVGAILAYVFRKPIANYYKSPIITGLMIYIIARPMFANIISLYQSLYISAGRVKVIAIRNFLISVIQVISVPLSFYISKNITAMLIVQLSLDVVQLIFFGFDFSKKEIKINPIRFDKKIVNEILKYAIPMGLALMMGTLFKESDKLIIAKLMDTESLAIYTNMSKQLPFEFIALSFTAVVTPAIVKFYYEKDIKSVIKIWSNYMEFGYISTWILCAGAIVCSKELLLFLYSDKYILGLNIFIIYLIVEMFRYTYFGIILSATGHTKYILNSSMISLVANIILNIIFYKIFGMVGPAIASLICVITMNGTQLIFSCKILNIRLKKIIKVKKMIITLSELIVTGLITYWIKILLYKITTNNFIILIITYIIYIVVNIMLNFKAIKNSLLNLKGEEEIKNEN